MPYRLLTWQIDLQRQTRQSTKDKEKTTERTKKPLEVKTKNKAHPKPKSNKREKLQVKKSRAPESAFTAQHWAGTVKKTIGRRMLPFPPYSRPYWLLPLLGRHNESAAPISRLEGRLGNGESVVVIISTSLF